MPRSIVFGFLILAMMVPSMALSGSGHADRPAELRAKASLILEYSEALAKIWPGYWPSEQAFILYDPAHGAVLVGADGRPRDISYRAGELPGARTEFVFNYPAGAPNMMLVTVDDDWPKALTTLFHEQFHDFQSDAFDRADWRHAGEYVDLTAIPDRAAFTAAAELERRVLADAVVARSAAERADLARRYIALRRARGAIVGESIIGRERFLERSEGTAQYAGLMAASVVLGENLDSVSHKLAQGLRRNLFANAEGSYSGNWFRWRAYDVGGAIAMLLERSGVDWKGRIEAGEALDTVLEQSLGMASGQSHGELIADTRRTYGAERISDEMTAALAAAPKTLESTAEFMALGARRLVIEVTTPVDRLSEGRQFSSTKQMIAVGRSATAYLDVSNFTMESPGISLTLEGRSVLTELLPSAKDEPLTQRYTIPLADGAVLPVLDTLPPGRHAMESLSVTIEGLTLKVDRPVAVTMAEDQVTLVTSVAAK